MIVIAAIMGFVSVVTTPVVIIFGETKAAIVLLAMGLYSATVFSYEEKLAAKDWQKEILPADVSEKKSA